MSHDDDSEYRRDGVDPTKRDVHKAIQGLDGGLYPDAFCRIFPDLAGDRHFVNIHHGDGVGTKLALYYLLSRSGLFGANIFENAAIDAAAMNFDDMACVGAVGCHYSLINMVSRHPTHIGAEVLAAIVRGFKKVCNLVNAELIAGPTPSGCWGGETADVADLTRTIDVMCAVFARFERAKVIDASRIAPGDYIVGFRSDGQAAWESEPNSGIRSNGLTLARHILLAREYGALFPESCSPEMIQNGRAYRGRFKLLDPLPYDDRFTIGTALASPTRLYAPLIQFIMEAVPIDDISAFIHCSGGGATKSLKFGAPGSSQGLRFRKSGYLQGLPPIFMTLLNAGVTPRELLEAFNGGIGLEGYFHTEATAKRSIEIAEAYNIGARLIGRVEERGQPGNEMTVEFGGHNIPYNNDK